MVYDICGIKLRFEYNYPDFFASRIKGYEDPGREPEYHMDVHIVGSINPPDAKPVLCYHDRTVMHGDKYEYIVKMDSAEEITDLIRFTTDLRRIDIFLVQRIGKRLPEVEYLLSGMMFFEIAIANGMIPIHAAAIEYGGEAILFSAPSQTGKSTQAELWRRQLPESRTLNEDKPLLFQKDGVMMAGGTPWSGKTPENTNLTAPVKCIVFLEKASRAELVSLSNQDKVKMFLRNIHRPREEGKLAFVLKAIESLVYNTPVYLFKATKETDSFTYLYHAIYRGDHL